MTELRNNDIRYGLASDLNGNATKLNEALKNVIKKCTKKINVKIDNGANKWFIMRLNNLKKEKCKRPL